MKQDFKSLLRMCLPRGIRPHRILFGPIKGQKLVTSWHDYPGAILGTTETRLLHWFAQNVNVGETWLDIGAHYGYVSLALCNLVGDNGRVFAFEPMLSSAGAIQHTRVQNTSPQLSIVPFALSACDTVEMTSQSATRGMIDSTIDSNGWAEPFFVSSADWLWPKMCDGNPTIHGIKVDVQGMEIETIRGMKRILTDHRPKLVIETHSGVNRQELMQVIGEAGYTIDPYPIDTDVAYADAGLLDDHSYYFSP